LEYEWKRPVLAFYRERPSKGERKAFAVVKTKKFTVSEVAGEKVGFTGSIEDFFPLMGEIDYIMSKEGMSDRYVVCWFDDAKDEDFEKSFRRLSGVSFPNGMKFSVDKKGKKTYNARYKAEHGKLK
jgi:trehalose-6-phosphatase